MTSPTGFRLKDAEERAEPFHYTMCGLDDIYLLNGYDVHNTKHGRGVSITNQKELHAAIGLHLVKTRKALGPKDIRFLRKHLDWTQEELAEELGVTSQTIARYEKGTTEIAGPADKLIRFIFVFRLLPESEQLKIIGEIKRIAQELIDVDETRDEPVCFGSTSAGWLITPPMCKTPAVSAMDYN